MYVKIRQLYVYNNKMMTIVNIVIAVCLACCFNNADAKALATVPSHINTKNVTAQYCPESCTIGNQTLCYMIPCSVPPCQDPAKHRPTDCCYYCPNGPNCKAPDGALVKANHWKIVNGKNCTCELYNTVTICH